MPSTTFLILRSARRALILRSARRARLEGRRIAVQL